MTPERWQEIKRGFDEVLQMENSARPAFLKRIGTIDPDLRSEIEGLLRHHLETPSFLDRPAVDPQWAQSPQSPKHSARLGQQLGVYQLIEEIGHGGMGEVYRAARVDGQYEKQVAVKLVRGGFDTALVLERFRHERQILASLDHPNIGHLFDGGTTDDGQPYLIMELIEGTAIDRHCAARGLSITERLELFRPVCAAVQYAHQHLVIHRDIKPSNVLVTADGIPKLLDFGIAKILSPSGNQETTVVHALTPEYASPEQIRGEPITTASDVYTLGVMLYQLLTGSSPYAAYRSQPPELARAICELEVGRPSTAINKGQGSTARFVSQCREGSPTRLQRRLAGDLDNIVLKAMRKEPQRRYASAEQFGEDLRRHLQGLPVLAASDSVPYRVRKFVKRHKTGVVAGILVVIALVGGLAATLREAQIARANAQRAEKHFQEVRSLANSLMFEVHDSIAKVPGTMATRRLVVQRSLEYLDSLARDASGDIELERELATAYEKVGQLQGNGFGANLGDPKRSLESFQKALAIRQMIAISSASQVDDQVALARAYRLAGQVEWLSFGETKASLEKLRKAVAIAESSRSRAPAKSTYELAQDYKYLGDIQEGFGVRGSLGDLQGALESHRKALDLLHEISETAPSPESKQEVGMAEIALGDDLVKGGQREDAMAHYTRARDILEGLDHAAANTLFHFSLATCHTRIGDVLLIEGHPKDALQHYQREFELLQAVAAAEPEDAEAQSYRITARGDIGHALVESGRITEGQDYLLRSLLEQTSLTNRANDAHNRSLLASTEILVGESFERRRNTNRAVQHYSHALDIYSAISAADSGDLEDAVHVVETRNHLGRAMLSLGRVQEGSEQYRQALAVASELDSSNPGNMQVLYGLADTYAGLGNVAAHSGATRGGQAARQAGGKNTAEWYRMSLETWRKIPYPARMSPDELAVGNPYDQVVSLAAAEGRSNDR